jgi:hypothetical protein
MELNEFEYQMLDALLEAFGASDTLTREQVLKLFDGDEGFAADIANILTAEGLVAVAGLTGEGELPGELRKLPKMNDFIKQGGFAERAAKLAGPKKPEWDEELLRKRNTALENEKLKLQRVIRDQEAEQRALDQKFKHLEKYKYALYGALLLIAGLASWIIWNSTHPHHL